MWPLALSAVYHWIYGHIVIAVEFFGFAIARKDRQHMPLESDDLISALVVLQGIIDGTEALHIDEMNSVVALIVKIMEYTAGLDVYREQWVKITHSLDAIHTLLLGFGRDLEISARGSDRPPPTPNDLHGEGNRIPDYLVPHLRDLCTCLKHVISMLQGCLKPPRFYRWNKDLQKGLEKCAGEISCLHDAFSTCLIPRLICRISLDNPIVFQTPLHVMEHATPKRYRLVDCEQLVKSNTLIISEFPNFPHVPYAAISYVWRGNDIPPGYNAEDFSVAGAEEADPIGVEVLRNACVAALSKHARYLWIDRLSIMQTSKDDKKWQIREMYRMYRSCIICIVLPGGLRRLVPLDEETNWIHRGWTLQEALAPPSIFVLFAWKFGQCDARTGDQFWDTTIEEVVPNKSAMTSPTLLLDACTSGFISFKYKNQPVVVNARLFGTFASPNVTALSVLMSKDSSVYVKQYAIWKSALMRTSSRPVDMIFSIMGLFGVILDPGAFAPDDRIGATVALARQVLQQGGRASWLGVCLLGQPCPYLSTFPTFPRTHVSGKACVRLLDKSYHQVSEFMDNEYPYLLAPARFVTPGGRDEGPEDEIMETGDPVSLAPVLPKGSLSDTGYLTLSAKAIQVLPVSTDTEVPPLVGDYDDDERPTLLKDAAGNVWKVSKGEDGPGPVTFAVMLGLFVSYIAATVPAKMSLKAMLIEEHGTKEFHLRSYFSIDFESKYWVESEWTERQFCVGGPKLWDRGAEVEELEEQGELAYTSLAERSKVDTPQLYNNATLLKFKDATQKGRAEALPQWLAEQQLIVESS